MLIHRLALCGLLGFAASAQPALAADTDVSGRWTGKTRCPLGLVNFTIDVEGNTGTFSHGGYGPNKLHPLSYPITIRLMKGWEGEWVYFQNAESSAPASFSDLNGLLSTDGRKLEVRRGVSTGDCQAFWLTRSSIPQPQPATPAAEPLAPPQHREPTEAEMRAALEYSLYGDSDAYRVDNPLNGMATYVNNFAKLGCSPAHAKAGYMCDYTVELDMQFHSNEGTAAGNDYAGAVQRVLDILIATKTPPGPQTSSARFLYVPPKARWMKMSD